MAGTLTPDIRGYKNKVEYYKYSSLGVYLGIRKDRNGIVDAGFILNQLSKDPLIAKKQYLQFVKRNSDSGNNDAEFRHGRTECRSERKVLVRNSKPEDVIGFVATYTKQDKSSINIKYIKR